MRTNAIPPRERGRSHGPPGKTDPNGASARIAAEESIGGLRYFPGGHRFMRPPSLHPVADLVVQRIDEGIAAGV